MGTLRALGLAKSYRSRQVVHDVSIELARGEVVGLLGPNGAGKTTCFYMIVGLVAADAGRILIDDTDVTRLPIHARAKLGLGYLAQEASVFRKLSVADNIYAVLETQNQLSDDARDQRLQQLLDEFSLAHLAQSLGMSLSGGERRRLEIARALASDPGFILLDEPFAGVDPISVVDIQRIIRNLSERNIGVLITDHNVRETLSICQRAYIVNSGSVIAAGAPDDVLANEQVRQVYLGKEFKI
ncbi:MAG: LPS export ABC transporter ATP-binding protein [Gammaproteobacteria bacterium]|nr:LPS export ABC transporter ATP-binding protein [Gammaproteobacteria bacterium]